MTNLRGRRTSNRLGNFVSKLRNRLAWRCRRISSTLRKLNSRHAHWWRLTLCTEYRQDYIQSSKLLKSKDWGSVAVLGRGSSLARYLNGETHYDTVIAVNFISELENEAFQSRFGLIKRLILLYNLKEKGPAPSSVRNLSNAILMLTVFHDKRIEDRSRKSFSLDKLGKPIFPMPSELSADLFRLGNNSTLFALCIAGLKSQKIDIFGLDFYESEPMFLHARDEWIMSESDPLVRYSELMKEAFGAVISEFPRTEFRIFTQGNVVSELANLIVHR